MMDVLQTFSDIFRLSLPIIISLILVANAGLFSERSGVVNIALEGIMVFGAVFGIIAMKYTNEAGVEGQSLFFIGFIIAGLAGMLLSSLHAFASINMKANQVISGTAINIFSPAFGVFLANALFGIGKIKFPKTEIRIRQVVLFGQDLSEIPIIGNMFFYNTGLSIFFGILLIIISYLVMYKTTFGLRLRSCGEHPQASDAAGINVYKMRYAGVLISGALAGIGGYFYVLSLTSTYDPLFAVSGYGFLALAVLISGQWKPGRIIVMATLFGLLSKLSQTKVFIPALNESGLSTQVLNLLPFLITLLVLIFTSKNSAAPKASGEAYDPGKR